MDAPSRQLAIVIIRLIQSEAIARILFSPVALRRGAPGAPVQRLPATASMQHVAHSMQVGKSTERVTCLGSFEEDEATFRPELEVTCTPVIQSGEAGDAPGSAVE